MFLSKSDIKSKVRLRIDEIRANESDFDGTVDETDLDALIEGLSLEALTYVNANASAVLLEPDVVLSSNDTPPTGISYAEDTEMVPGQRVGVFCIPPTFLRLVSAKNEDWAKSVREMVDEGDNAMEILLDPYLTGSKYRPYVATGLDMDQPDIANGGYYRNIYLFTVKAGSKSQIAYMIKPEYVTESNVQKLSVSRYLVEPFIYYLASLVLTTTGDARAQYAQAKAMQLMGALPQETEG